LSAEYCWCPYLRLRVSRGLSIERIHANCIVGKQNLAMFPVFSATDSVAYELEVIENGLPPTVICQAAFVLTNSEGNPRVRIFTFRVPTTMDPQVALAGVDERGARHVFRATNSGQNSQGRRFGSF
jgi:hypothetical protein